MKIKKGFELQNICGENVVMATGIENIDFSKLITLNESGAYLYTKIGEQEFTADTLAQMLCEEYDVTPEQAATDAQEFCTMLRNSGVAE